MSITTYSELKTAIGNWLNRSDLTSYIPDFITLAEDRIYTDLKVRAMEVAFSSTISSGVIAVPSGYLELSHAYVDGSSAAPLARKSAQWIYEYYPTRSSDGKPAFIARDVDNFIFGPYPDSNYTIKGTYYKRLDALSDSNTTNWFLTNVRGLYLFGALVAAEPFLKNDPRTEVWEKEYLKVKYRIEQQEKFEKYSGSPLNVTVSKY